MAALRPSRTFNAFGEVLQSGDDRVFRCGKTCGVTTHELEVRAATKGTLVTIIVSVKINDGVVMAADSASTFASGQVYLHTNKITNLVKGLPIGVMVTGAGGIGSESVETLCKDLRMRLSGYDKTYEDWKLDAETYTMSQVADFTLEMFSAKAAAADQEVWMLLRLCGYSAGCPLAEVWDLVVTNKPAVPTPLKTQLQVESSFGPRWTGETEALDRLILGLGNQFAVVARDLGLTEEQAADAQQKIYAEMYEMLYLNAMPVEDAIALARYMVDVTSGFTKFAVKRPKTVGGPVEIATITKHEGFRWVQRKHFYPAPLDLTPVFSSTWS